MLELQRHLEGERMSAKSTTQNEKEELKVEGPKYLRMEGIQDYE